MSVEPFSPVEYRVVDSSVCMHEHSIEKKIGAVSQVLSHKSWGEDTAYQLVNARTRHVEWEG